KGNVREARADACRTSICAPIKAPLQHASGDCSLQRMYSAGRWSRAENGFDRRIGFANVRSIYRRQTLNGTSLETLQESFKAFGHSNCSRDTYPPAAKSR